MNRDDGGPSRSSMFWFSAALVGALLIGVGRSVFRRPARGTTGAWVAVFFVAGVGALAWAFLNNLV